MGVSWAIPEPSSIHAPAGLGPRTSLAAVWKTRVPGGMPRVQIPSAPQRDTRKESMNMKCMPARTDCQPAASIASTA